MSKAGYNFGLCRPGMSKGMWGHFPFPLWGRCGSFLERPIIKWNHFEVIMSMCFSHDTKHVYFEVILFYNSKDIYIYNILRHVIPRILRHMCNLHIKETEISQKRSKGIKNWNMTYSVILSVLSNKINLILGFSSPLMLVIWVVSYRKYNILSQYNGKPN